MSGDSVERLLGEIAGELKGIRADVDELKEAEKDHSEKRSALHKAVDAVKTDVVLIKKEMEDTAPDIQRCRMLRHWGVVSIGIIGVGGAVFGMWDHIRRAFQ